MGAAAGQTGRDVAGNLKHAPRLFRVRCKSCDEEFLVHITTFGFLCEDCERSGAGWATVFDRDAGTGSVPVEIQRRYGVDRFGRSP